MTDYIFIDGSRVKNSLSIRSLFYGEGLFETFRYKSMLPALIDKHLQRMDGGAKLLKVPFPEKEYIKELVEKAILESELKDAYVKICLLSDGESVFHKTAKTSQVLVIIREYEPPKQSVKIKVNSFKRISESPLLNVKSLSYLENIQARREASRSGFDESLFLNERDEAMECSTSNIFWFNRDTLFTPARECGLLSGTTRDLILSFITECGMSSVEGQFSLNDLIAADCVFITNSLIGCVPVTKVEGHSINPDNNLFNKIKSTLFQKLKWV